MSIIGYYAHPELTDCLALDAIVLIDELGNGYYSFFNVIDGHGQVNEDYVKACRPISQSEYLNMTHNYYTPVDYLEDD